MIRDRSTQGQDSPHSVIPGGYTDYPQHSASHTYDPILNCKVLAMESGRPRSYAVISATKEDLLYDVEGPFSIEFFIKYVCCMLENEDYTQIIAFDTYTAGEVYVNRGVFITLDNRIAICGMSYIDYYNVNLADPHTFMTVSTLTLNSPDWNHVCIQRIDNIHMQLYINGFLSDEWEWDSALTRHDTGEGAIFTITLKSEQVRSNDIICICDDQE